MKAVMQIFWRDIQNIFRRPFAAVVLVGIIIIPSLYAWFNIYACWDPYGNTGNIHVAVANQDDGADLKGLNVNVGGMIVDNLAKNDQIGWEFMSEEEAMDAVKSGKVYATVVIPPDFSTDLLSVLSVDITQPKIDYYVNEKKNAIAPKITDKGAQTVQQQVNETFIQTAADLLGTLLQDADSRLGDSADQAISNLTTNLQTTSGQLDGFSTTVSSFASMSSAVQSLLDVADAALPQDTLQKSASLASDAQQAMSAGDALASSLDAGLSALFEAAAQAAGSVSSVVGQALEQAGSDATAAADKLDSAVEKLNTLSQLNSGTVASLQAIKNQFPDLAAAVDPVITKLNGNNASLSSLSGKLSAASAQLRRGQAAGGQTWQQMQDDASQLSSGMQTASDSFHRDIAPAFDRLAADTFSGLGDLSGFLSTMGGADWDTLFSSMRNGLSSTTQALQSLQSVLQDAKTKVDNLISDLQTGTQDERLARLAELIRRDPAVVSSFLAAPVQVQTNGVFPIANYGSAMTPFYTVLCLWVGAVILVALIKVHLKPEDRRALTPNKCYFGRFLLFCVCGILQAAVVCAGDLWLLGIQCPEPALFLFAGVYTSFVFTLFVYTLVISFGDVGKAIAVIFLVLQVAGAGGTFPIETTPAFFQALNPIFPFTHAINAMRETVGGLYGWDYWLDLLKLSAYIPVSLLIGLVLRKPLMKVNHFLEGRLHQTGVM